MAQRLTNPAFSNAGFSFAVFQVLFLEVFQIAHQSEDKGQKKNKEGSTHKDRAKITCKQQGGRREKKK